MSHIMKMGKPRRYETEEEEEQEEEEFDEEEEEEEFDEESFEEEEESEEKVVEKFDPNIIIVKVQKAYFGSKQAKFMKIDREIELKWLIIHYCEKMEMDHRNFKFMFNGACVRNSDTPLKLSMVDQDIIYVVLRNSNQGVDGHSPYWYKTLCIRMHKRRDTFVRVTSNGPLLPQIKRQFSDGGSEKRGSTCFAYKGEKMEDFNTVNFFTIEDGDIIDAFNFEDNRSSLSFVTGPASTLRQPPSFKGFNPDINKSGPRKNVLGTPGTLSRPRETQFHSNRPVQQQTTRPRPPTVVMYKTGPPYPGRNESRIDATIGTRLV